MKITIPISVGELLDKITILQIKSNHTDNEYLHKELDFILGKVYTSTNNPNCCN